MEQQDLTFSKINTLVETISDDSTPLLVLYNFLNKVCNHYDSKDLVQIRVLTLIFLKQKVLLNDFILECLGYSGNYFKKRQNVLKLMQRHKDIVFKTIAIYNRTYFLLHPRDLVKLCKHLRNRKNNKKQKFYEMLIFCKTLCVKYKNFLKSFHHYNFIKFKNYTNSKNISKNICEFFSFLIDLSNDSNIENLFGYEQLILMFDKLMNDKMFINLHMLAETSVALIKN